MTQVHDAIANAIRILLSADYALGEGISINGVPEWDKWPETQAAHDELITAVKALEAHKADYEALKAGYDAARLEIADGAVSYHRKVESNLRQQLKQLSAPQPPVVTQEPFGYFRCTLDGWIDCASTDAGARPLYEHPAPQPAPICEPTYCEPLTDEQIGDVIRDAVRSSYTTRDGTTSYRIARAIERAHGIGCVNAR